MSRRNEDSCDCEGSGSGWSYVGYGIACFLFCIGIGGCAWLGKQTGPLVIVKHEVAR